MFIHNWTKKINDALIQSGITEKEFCDKMAITCRHLTYLRRSSGKIDDKIYAKICETLGVPLTYFTEEANFIKYEPIEDDSNYINIFADANRKKYSIIKLREEYVERLSANPHALFMVHIFDDSMSPLLPYNADAIIDPDIPALVDGKTYYINLNGKKMFRNLVVGSEKIIALIALKDSIRSEIIESDNLEILGRVILVMNEV